MDSGVITDSQITASSFNNNNQSPAQARLNRLGWTAASYDPKSWLQIDLGSYKIVTRLATRGSQSWVNRYWATRSWVTSYRLQFSDDGFVFHFYQEPRDSFAKVCKNDLIMFLSRIRLFRLFSLFFFLMCRCLAEIETLPLLCTMNSASQSQPTSSGYCLYSGIITYQ